MGLSATEIAKAGARGKAIAARTPLGNKGFDAAITIQVHEVKGRISDRVPIVKTGKMVLLEVSPGHIVEAELGQIVRMPGFRLGKITGSLGQKLSKMGLKISAYEPDEAALCMIEGKAMFEEDLRKSGGCFDLSQVQSLLGSISRQAVDQRVQKGSLIAVTGDGNKRVYPVFQFHDGALLPGLVEVLSALPKTNEWALVNFFVNADSIDDRTPVEMLQQNDIEGALAAARDFADSGV